MQRRFYNTTCKTYRTTQTKIRGSLKDVLNVVYEKLDCSIWSSTRRFGETTQAVHTNGNSWEINFMPEEDDIQIGDIVEINGIQYVIQNVILHHDAHGRLDNIQTFAIITTKNAD